MDLGHGYSKSLGQGLAFRLLFAFVDPLFLPCALSAASTFLMVHFSACWSSCAILALPWGTVECNVLLSGDLGILVEAGVEGKDQGLRVVGDLPGGHLKPPLL